jgi:hypothetical protein
MRNLLNAVLALLLIFTVGSCKKGAPDVSFPVNQGDINNDPIPPYIFDWETSTYMPTSPANQIQMPWNSGTTAIDPGLASDYKKVDGWKLVWNTFSPTTTITNPPTPLFFALYNVYSGLLRFYLWQGPTAVTSSYVTHGLGVYTNSVTSAMLNFNGQEISDPTINQSSFDYLINQPINASGGTWYVFQYEMAYDSNIGTTSFPNFGLKWTSQYISVSSINLNGTLQGSIKGALGTNSPASFNLNSILFNGVQAFFGSLQYLVAVGGAPAAIIAAYNAASQNIVKNTLSTLFSVGGNSQQINLTVNANLKLSGNSITNGGLEDMKLVLPGQANALTANGNIPDYNSIMGIFNLTAKPSVSVITDFDFSIDNPNVSVLFSRYTLNSNSVNISFNPSIINTTPSGATITNLQRQLVLIPANNATFLFGDLTSIGCCSGIFASWDDLNKIEHIGNNQAIISPNGITNPSLTVYSPGSEPSAKIGIVGVRVSFNVVPNNGAKSYKIAHTFYASVQ